MGGRALAQPAEPLTWNAPPGCPQASDVLGRVRAQLEARQLVDQPWRASAQVFRAGSRYRLELSLEVQGAAAARREVEAASCGTLADTTAALIALALLDAQSPSAVQSPASAAPASEAPPPTAAESSAPVEQTGPAPDTAAPSFESAGELPDTGAGTGLPFGYGVGASLRLDVGMLPAQPAFGVAPRVLVKLGPLSATAGLTFWLAARHTADRYPAAQLEGRGVLADLVLGFELTRAPLSVAACLAIEHGRLSVRSLDIQRPDSAHYRWTAAGGGVRAGLGLGKGFYVSLELLGLAPWSRQGFLLRTPAGDLPVFRAAPLVLRTSVELAYVFE
ncbi:MAG TPA: hypothetical protein VJR89_36320 [Polyangiales bacterium]|nr:hypothetical protein [Polyangiales bacterium]